MDNHGCITKCFDSFGTTRAAVGHFNVADLVLLKAVVAAAVEVRVPVIVGASEGERDFLGTYELAALVKVMREEHASQFSLTQIIRIHWRKQQRRRGQGSIQS